MRFSLFILITGLLFFGCTTLDQNVQQPPNIIYILADDLGYGELGAYGQEKIKTPNLDLLAAQGMRFTQHYTGAPVCAPSRYMFLTGTHAGHAYIRGNYELGQFEDENEGGQMPIPETTPTLAKMLKNAGYQTAMVGKWGLGMNGTTGSPLLQGFDYYYGYLDQKQAHNYYPTHLWENDEPALLNNDYFLVHTPIEKGSDQQAFDQFKGVDYSPDRMLGKALHFLDSTSSNKPFFLYYPSPIPHVSLQIPDSLLNQYKDQFDEKEYYGTQGYTAHQTPRAAYAAMITHLDYEVGKIWEAVKARGQEDNTLILFSSDNGPTFAGGVDAEYFNSAAGLRGLKMDVYEGGIRIPFIAYWKGKIQPGVSNAMVSQLDLLSSLAQLVGSDVRTEDSLPLMDLLMGKSDQGRNELVIEATSRTAFKKEDWVMIPPYKGPAVNEKVQIELGNDSDFQLYNLAEDIRQQNNLAESQPEKLQEMLTAFEAIRGDGYGKTQKLELK